ncbi:Protein of unknown function [Pyronema omphalodes CBS 100304]|uniref:Uncharacterized protein n=1 Tax=Pyronema omphalodes (strain CBS 100304) TaxID=1076935 RepID=U4L614_PYROM|nr:Protein of unknown function [Pyronema omphalodes CBS 100304]
MEVEVAQVVTSRCRDRIVATRNLDTGNFAVKLDLTTAILQDTAQLKLPGMRSSHDSVVLLLYSESSEAIEGYLHVLDMPHIFCVSCGRDVS